MRDDCDPVLVLRTAHRALVGVGQTTRRHRYNFAFNTSMLNHSFISLEGIITYIANKCRWRIGRVPDLNVSVVVRYGIVKIND